MASARKVSDGNDILAMDPPFSLDLSFEAAQDLHWIRAFGTRKRHKWLTPAEAIAEALRHYVKYLKLRDGDGPDGDGGRHVDRPQPRPTPNAGPVAVLDIESRKRAQCA
jgi:hypothetical protein